jgi:MoaA/NifB/PqqE/SkfB family radical SAM enzyme
MKLNKVKKIIKKIPLASGAAKLLYDWRQEKRLEDRVKRLGGSGNLPFTDKAPEKYRVGYEPTIRCNLKCKMCYQGQTRSLRRSELNTEETFRIFEKLKEKIKEIKLVGGEPLVRADIFDLIGFWDENGIRIILQTNCTLINEKNIGALKDFKKVSDILTSLDGPPEIHDAVRGVPGSFGKLKKAIELIQKNRPDIPITIFATMLGDNLDSFYQLIDVCGSLKIRTINAIFEQVYSKEEVKGACAVFEKALGWKEGSYRLNTQIRDHLFPDKLSSAGLKKKLSKIRFYGLRKGCFVNFVPFNYYLNPLRYLEGKPGRPFCLKLLSPELRINQTGDVIWCDVIEKSFGNLLEKTPDEIWLSEEYQEFRQYLFKNSLPICRRCCKATYI